MTETTADHELTSAETLQALLPDDYVVHPAEDRFIVLSPLETPDGDRVAIFVRSREFASNRGSELFTLDDTGDALFRLQTGATNHDPATVTEAWITNRLASVINAFSDDGVLWDEEAEALMVMSVSLSEFRYAVFRLAEASYRLVAD